MSKLKDWKRVETEFYMSFKQFHIGIGYRHDKYECNPNSLEIALGFISISLIWRLKK